MKKISFLILLSMLLGLAGKAQVDPMAAQTNLLNYTALENKLKKSNDDIQDPKKNIKAKTWLIRSGIMLDIYAIHGQYLRKGMSPVEAKIFFKEPKEVKSYQDGADAMEDHVYDRIILTYRNNLLDTWKETSKIYETPLQESKKSIDEAIKLDTEAKEAKDIKDQLAKLKLALESEAVFAYNLKDYTTAYNNFDKILSINDMPQMEKIQDTIIIYNAARAAYEMQNYKDAVRLFNNVKALNYDEPFLYVFLKNGYFNCGDTLNGVESLKEGFKKYSSNQSILIELINYYLVAQETDQALELLRLAQKDDPTNVSYIFAEGTLYDRMGNFEEAKKTYSRSLEIDPKFFNAAYNLGVLHYNKAVKMYEDMVNITDNQEYEKERVNADAMFKAAIPYMEMAHEIDPNDKSSLETLKTLYLRLQMNEKYEEVNNLLKSM